MIEASPADKPTVIYTDHSTVGIAKATILSSSAVDRVNLRLVRAYQYIQQFNLQLFHRPGKENRVADALSRLPTRRVASRRAGRFPSPARLDQLRRGPPLSGPLHGPDRRVSG
jgi:hypothetical protein